jgi:hypothetical protein
MILVSEAALRKLAVQRDGLRRAIERHREKVCAADDADHELWALLEEVEEEGIPGITGTEPFAQEIMALAEEYYAQEA